MNVYILTNLVSGAQALVFANMEHEARYRRPDGAVWRVGHWYEPGGRRVAATLDWWPGSPRDIAADPVMQGVDTDSGGDRHSLVVATKSGRRPARIQQSLESRPPRRAPERSAPGFATVTARRPRRRVIETVPDTV